MPAFRISAKNHFLTYAQCPIPKEDVLAFLVGVFQDFEPHIRVSHELHEDGSSHLHAIVVCLRKFERRGAGAERTFDIERDGHTYHPNYQSCRDPKAVFDYISKDDDFVDFGNPADHCGTKKSNKEQWAAALETQNKDDFLKAVTQASPRDFIIFNDKIESFAEKKFAPPLPLFEPMEDFDITAFPDLQAFADQLTDVSFPRRLRLASLACTRTGFARCADPPNYHIE